MRQATVSDRAEINVSREGTGDPGNLNITARDLLLLHLQQVKVAIFNCKTDRYTNPFFTKIIFDKMFATTLAINEYIIDIKPDLTKIEKGVMIQAIPTIATTVTFDEFIAWYPEASGCHYELRSGEIVEMPKPTGKHSRVAGFIALKAGIEIERLKLPYFIPKECVIKSVGDDSGYEPDVIVLDERSIMVL